MGIYISVHDVLDCVARGSRPVDDVGGARSTHDDVIGAIAVHVTAAVDGLSGAEDLEDYQFNKHVIQHLFCPNCGSRVAAAPSAGTSSTWR